MSLPELSDRQREILRAVIHEFITTAQPVASGALVRRYALPVSSATVRSELAELEDLGLLTHPHTSAGRVPTDLGYRYFIESLMPDTALQPDEQLTVSHQFQQAQRDTAEWLRLAASTLARLSAEASIVTQPAGTKSALKHVDVVPIHERRVLIVAVIEGGAVHVAIGAENRVEPLLDCSLVFGRYGGSSGVIGYVGIVGPRRMDYARSIGAVSFVGRLMSDLVRVVEGN